MEIIKLKNISFSYSEQNGSDDFFLENLDLIINSGDFISILGPNGSGKSTMIKIIANILKPATGTSTLYQDEYSTINRNQFAKHVAFVPQNSGTNFPYSVYEIVMMGRSPYLNLFGVEKQSDHKLVLDTLELLEILHLKNKGINQVSGGEAQRALIARAIVQQPKILLLDEPNTHLDIKHQLSIFSLLHKFNKENGLTIVTISHDLNLSNYFTSRSILMKSGKILYDDTPDKILTESNIREIFDVESKIIKNNNNSSFISLISNSE